MKPLANFSCESGKCDKKGRRSIYELPINATRCAVCGSKKIRRLYDAVNVRTGSRAPDNGDMRHTSSSKARRIDQIAEPAMLTAEAQESRRRTLEAKYPMVKAVPMRNLDAELHKVYMSDSRMPMVDNRLIGKKAELGSTEVGLPPVHDAGVGRIPVKVDARDREYRVARTADGTPTIEKAG